jgi:hypothetical protein
MERISTPAHKRSVCPLQDPTRMPGSSDLLRRMPSRSHIQERLPPASILKEFPPLQKLYIEFVALIPPPVVAL